MPPASILTCATPQQLAQINAALASIATSCPSLSITWIQDTTCASGGGGTIPSAPCAVTVNICIATTNPLAPNPARDCRFQVQTIIHELRHVEQACAQGLCSLPWKKFLPPWNDHDNAICREVDAYCQEYPRSCSGGVPTPAGLSLICGKSCDSTNPTKGNARCRVRCAKIAARCGGGTYTPPPWRRPWYIIPIDPVIPRWFVSAYPSECPER